MTPQEWNRAVLAHAPASGAFLQAHEWGAFLERDGATVRRFSADGAMAHVVRADLKGPLFGWNLFRGPVGTPEALRALLKTIAADLRGSGGIFLHGEPARDDIAPPQAVSARSRQPRVTALLDLTPGEDALLAAMRHKTRYNIRLAHKHGVTVRLGAGEDFAKVWPMFAATARRDGFALHGRRHYETMLSMLAGALSETGRPTAHLVLAEHEDDALAALILLRFGATATYLHGASSDAKRNLMAPHALHWDTIRLAKKAGCTTYDFWGVAPEDAPADHPWSGITRFKMGFGPRRLDMPEAWELPLRPHWYRLYRLANRLRGRT